MRMNRQTYVALTLDSYIAIDLETTGLDPDKDEIIEVGMVRVEPEEKCERYNQLFKPIAPIPRAITQLTGIRTEDCQDQPSLEEKFSEILEFLQDDWIIAHNVSFDLSFLQKAHERFMPDFPFISAHRILDTLELSRILLPWLPNHRLETIAEFLNIKKKPEHRALADAEVTALIFRNLIYQALSLDPQTMTMMHHILEGVPDGLCDLFEKLSSFIKKYNVDQKPYWRKGPSNIIGKGTTHGSQSEQDRIDIGEIESFFQKNGNLSQVLPGYETRTPQLEMAKCVGSAFNQDAILVAEAGTGVGKSLAYLVPSLVWTMKTCNDKVIISTHTKTLQNQLFTKELPLLAQLYNESFVAVLLKGRANYICLRHWKNHLSHLHERFTQKQRRKILPLVVWVHETQTGDIEENAGFQHRRNKQIWSELNCEGRHCLGSQCEHEAVCFYQKIRRMSRSANIVLVNHSLLFSDAAAGHSVLGNYDSLIIDEAHQIERIASDCLGKTLHRWLFQDVSQRLYRSTPHEMGILFTIRRMLGKVKKQESETMELIRTLDRLIELSQELPQTAHQLFQSLTAIFSSQYSQREIVWKYRIRKSEELFGTLPNETDNLKNILETLSIHLSRFLSLLEEFSKEFAPVDEGIYKELESITDQVLGLQELLTHFLQDDYSESIVWCEIRKTNFEKDIMVYSVPLDIGSILAMVLYPRLKRGLLTSATLSIGENFDYIIKRLGIDRVDQDRILTRVFGSPFDFSEQVLVLVPTFLANPKDKSFPGDVSTFLKIVLSFHSRGTMVLFTSHKLLREVYDSIQSIIDEIGIRLLGQGIDGSRTALLKMFQEDEKSILLGTNSFWEGVDVPGSALELLIITKLPFDVPTEPLVEARMEKAQADTGSGFFNYSVPEAIVKFRQGFGRLIRSQEDRGVVILLDHRLVDTNYGNLFLDSLPVKTHICNNSEILMETLNEWFV